MLRYIIKGTPTNNKEKKKMAAKIDKDTCVGCGACVDTCPVSAIKMDGDKADIAESDCIECGACVGGCPCEAISL